jgi:ATP-dependent RNA helicase SUPV3L1/SUV3
MQVAHSHRRSSFNRPEFDQWLHARRAEEGLPTVAVREGRHIFKNWLSEVWPVLGELPEAAGLAVFTERDVVMLMCQHREERTLAGHKVMIRVHDFLPINRPKSPAAFAQRLRALSEEAARRVPFLEAEVRLQIPRIEQAIEQNRDRLRDSDIAAEVGRLDAELSTRQFPERVGRITRELALRAAQRRMAEGIALHSYHETFPLARERNRRLLFVAGPTNSGKTYTAFQKLAAARRGVYLAPLRLMAAEFWDRMQTAGVHCSLITGEERIVDPYAEHVSSTIEMLATDAEYDVAIIDEVQMISDKDRGWAWTQAIVGVNAELVILVGSPDAEGVLREIASRMGETLEVMRTERLSPLMVADEPLDPDAKVESGTAFISFSRRDVLSWKQTLGAAECAAIYGALSPEVRREEARRFNQGEAKIISATDAIGMGLNLPVKTVVFTTLQKFDGEKEVTLSDSATRQIAGRAGRFGMHEVGVVTALNHRDLDQIRKSLAAPPEQLPLVAPIAPHMKMLEFLSRETGKTDLSSLLDCFSALPGNTDLFCKADVSSMRDLAGEIGDFNLPLETQFVLCACPVDTRSGEHIRHWRDWVANVAENVPSTMPRGRRYEPERSAASPIQLQDAEIRVRLLAAYRWMNQRMPEMFPEADNAVAVSSAINQFISNSLKEKIVRRCRRCGRGLPDLHRFVICETCFKSRAERPRSDRRA